MRVRAVLVVAGVLFWLTGCDQTDSQVSISRVEATGCDRPQQRIGIGTVIADGIVLTAAHVVEGDLRELRVDDEAAAVIAIDAETDLALVAVIGEPDASSPTSRDTTTAPWNVATWLDVTAGPVEVHTADGVIVTDLTRTLTLRVEDVSTGDITEREALELAVVVDEGDSGSPVVDADGRVVGVVVLRRPSTGVSYATRIPAFTDLLHGVVYQDVRAGWRTADGVATLARAGACT